MTNGNKNRSSTGRRHAAQNSRGARNADSRYQSTTSAGEHDDAVKNAVQLDPNNPIPRELASDIGYSIDGHQYIPFVGEKDRFFNVILEAATNSTTHAACITTKTDCTIGNGIIATTLKEDEQVDQGFKDFMSRINARGQHLNTVTRLGIETFYKFGNCVFEIVRGSVGGKRFVYVYVKNMLDCRLEIANKITGVPMSTIISKQFRREGVLILNEKNSVRIPLYQSGPGDKSAYWKKDELGIERTTLWLINPVSGYDFYGMPSSIGSLIYQVLEYGGARFNLDNIENNMVIGGVLMVYGSTDSKEALKIAKKIKSQHTGYGKQGRMIVHTTEDPNARSDYHQFDTQRDGSYIEQDNKNVDKIVLANGWDKGLAGLDSGSALGRSSSYMQEKYDQVFATTIQPVQEKFKTDFIDPLIEICDEWLGQNWAKYNPNISVKVIGNRTNELTNSVKGFEAFMKVIDKVASGAWEYEAAVLTVMRWFKMTEEEARRELGTITVRNNKNNNNQNQPINV